MKEFKALTVEFINYLIEWETITREATLTDISAEMHGLLGRLVELKAGWDAEEKALIEEERQKMRRARASSANPAASFHNWKFSDKPVTEEKEEPVVEEVVEEFPVDEEEPVVETPEVVEVVEEEEEEVVEEPKVEEKPIDLFGDDEDEDDEEEDDDEEDEEEEEEEEEVKPEPKPTPKPTPKKPAPKPKAAPKKRAPAKKKK